MFLCRVLFFERPRPAASVRPPYLIYLSTSNEVRPRERSDRDHFLPISNKKLFVIRQAGEYGLTRGTCFVAGRIEVVAVAGRLWVS